MKGGAEKVLRLGAMEASHSQVLVAAAKNMVDEWYLGIKGGAKELEETWRCEDLH